MRDALRTEAIVRALYKLYVSRLRSEKPWLSDWELDLQIRHLLAMPDDPVPPGHMTGGAVDVILGDVDGVRVDLEVPAKQIPRRQQAPTDCPGLPAVIVARRRALCSAMTSQGFHNYFKEYWHFSYGDGYWAVRRKSKVAIYGVAHAPINIDWTQHHDRRRLRHIASRSASQTSVAANF